MVKAATLASYSNTLRLHILPAFGATKVRHLQRGRLKAWLAQAVHAAQIVRAGIVAGIDADRVQQGTRGESVVAHRRQHLVGRIGQPRRVGRLLCSLCPALLRDCTPWRATARCDSDCPESALSGSNECTRSHMRPAEPT